MNQKRKRVILSNEISDLYSWDLGGYRQKVLVEGRSRELPVVVTLHGGPGTPVPFSVGCRGLFPEFTDRFIMVYWDQLGCGINNYVIDEQFSIESFVDMTVDLLRKVRQLFPANPIHVFAVSWGTVLIARTLEQAPGLVDGVVACGQLVKDVFLGQEVLKALEQGGLPMQKLERIRGIRREQIRPKDMQLIASSIRKYTAGYVNKNGKQAAIWPIVRGLLASPDYRLRDFKAVMVNGYRHNVGLWKELLCLDLSEALCRVQIPYRIFQGDTDIVASTETIKKLVESSGNPCLECQVVAHTGHMPGEEMMGQIFQGLIRLGA